MLKFYFAPGTCALASRITLEEAGAAYEPVKLDFAKTQQRSPDYLAVNPKGRVPALATDQGILTETPAILAYIAQTHPLANLAPLDDPFEFARVQSFNSYLCSTAPCMSPTLTACAATAGPTIPPRSRRCSARCPNRSAIASP
jgi:glutathione S-transferase